MYATANNYLILFYSMSIISPAFEWNVFDENKKKKQTIFKEKQIQFLRNGLREKQGFFFFLKHTSR